MAGWAFVLVISIAIKATKKITSFTTIMNMYEYSRPIGCSFFFFFTVDGMNADRGNGLTAVLVAGYIRCI